MKFSRFTEVDLSQKLLSIYCLAAAVLWLSLPPAADSQNSATGAPNALSPSREPITSALSLLENRLRLNVPFNQPIGERIGSLEMIVFGSPQPGSFLERLDRLQKAVPVSGSRNSSSPLASPLARPSGNVQTVNPQYRSGKTQSTAADSLHTPSSTQVWFPAPPEVATSNLSSAFEQQRSFLPKTLNPSYTDQLAIRLFQMTPLVSQSSITFVRIESAGAKIDQAGDYLEAVMKATKNRVVRFKQMPIPVYITPFSDAAFTNACVHAFEDWEERAGGLVSFRQVEDPHQARIRVIWSHLGLAKNPHDCSLGAHTLTSWRRQNSGMQIIFIGGVPIPLKLNSGSYSVPPQVIEVNLDLISAKPEEVRMRLLKNIVAHELGHALGILAHSSNSADLMYPVTDECSRLSQADINTIKQLYRKNVDIPL